MTFVVYIIRCKINGKAYIGSSCEHKRRWQSHVRDSAHGKSAIHRAVRKYGIENFEFEILKECTTREEMLSEEAQMIRTHGTFGSSGYNMTVDGTGRFEVGVPSPRKGRKMSVEWCKRNGDRHRGKKMSLEARQKMSRSRIGHTVSEETRKKISDGNRGKAHRKGWTHTEESRQKMSEKQRNRKREPLSEDHRQLISENMKKIWRERKLEKEDNNGVTEL